MDDLRLFIDALLVKPKRVAGSVDWRLTEREGQMRLQAPLIIDDEISALELVVDAYPRSASMRFKLMLNYRRNIYRVDYGEDETHLNWENIAVGILPGLICGSHFHSWEHNRH